MRSSEAVPAAQNLPEGGNPAVALPGAARAVAALAATKSRSARLANVERLRILAMYEIVAFHVSEHRLPLIGGLGLPIFLLLNNAFNCTLSGRMGTLGFLRTKVSRLLLPWLLWSLIYLAMQLLERLRHGESLTDGFSVWMVFGGTYEHLWFVPFALLGAVLISIVQEQTPARDHARMMLLALGAGTALTLADAWIIKTHQVPWPFLQWLFALPAIPFGFALGRAVIGADRALLMRSARLALGAAIVCFGCALLLPIPDMVRRYALSMLIVSAAFVWPGGMDPFSQRIAPLLFGVYLSHPLLERIYQGLHLPELGIAPFAALVFFAACILVVVFRRGPLRVLV